VIIKIANIFEDPYKYDGQNLRLVGEQLSMDVIASEFSDIFGKDVIYNPLTVEEVSQLPFASAPCMAQMCQFLGDPRSLKHDIAITKEVCFPKHPQTFRDWLLSHSESNAFQMVGLDMDAPDIIHVTVFGATSPEGRAVVKGLLADVRKQYMIRATTRHIDSDSAKLVKAYDIDRVELVYADFDDFLSCQTAVEGVEGAFLVTDFYEDAQQDMDVEERHAKNVIDACEASSTMKHLVFSTMESMENMTQLMKQRNGLNPTRQQTPPKENDNVVVANKFDAKARAAAYARTKRLSVTYVLMPCYTQHFFDMIERLPTDENGTDKLVMTVPLKDDQKVMCMNIDDLGPAVANIFDSYQVYAGREVGLVTDFISVADVRNIIEDVFLQDENSNVVLETAETSTEQWLEVKDTYMKDLGQMFVYMSHTDEVKMRRSIAKTMKLVPSARPLRQWIEQNVDNVAFREKLGIR
jgi:nucleoside-diphosphate-sugar epimerase